MGRLTRYQEYMGVRRTRQVEARTLEIGDHIWVPHFGWERIENTTHRGSRLLVELKIAGGWTSRGYHDQVTRLDD